MAAGRLIIPVFILFTGLLSGTAGPEVHPIQKPAIEKFAYTESDWSGKLDSLCSIYGSNKTIPEEIELQALLALSHYPELKDIPIEFILKEAIIPLASRPKPKTIFGKKDKRLYKVVISTGGMDQMEEILLHNLPFNAQVGIIGHELAHVSDYIGMSYSEIMSFACAYLYPHFREGIEKHTDASTIEHGLGWQLLDYAEYVRSVPSAIEKGTDWMDKYYLNPENIRKVMENIGYNMNTE